MVLVDDRDALGILGFEEAKRILEGDIGPDRVMRRLGDVAERGLAGVPPFATTSRTRVFLVTTPTSCSSSVTKTARTSVLDRSSPAACADASAGSCPG